MTLRRYAPLPLAALALACAPAIDERANTATAEYARFDPSNGELPLPNTIALQSFLAGDPGPSVLPCSALLAGDPTGTRTGVCAFARAGGWPANMPVTIDFVTGTLQGDGAIAYTPSPLDPASIALPGAALHPNVAVVDITNPTAPNPIYTGTPAFDAATGTLTLPPPGGLGTDWPGTAYVVLVRGGPNGVKTTAATGAREYLAMPTLFILREAVLNDRDLQLPENQALFPGTTEEKAAAGATLEPLRAAFHEGLYPLTLGLQAAGVDLPFAEMIDLQAFNVAPAGTVTIGEGTDPLAGNIAAGATKAIDAFTLQSNVGTATLVAITVGLSDPAGAVAELSINAASDCGALTSLGSLTTVVDGANTVLLTTYASAPFSPATQALYVCATASATNTGTVTGNVAVATAFPGTRHTSTDGDASTVAFSVP